MNLQVVPSYSGIASYQGGVVGVTAVATYVPNGAGQPGANMLT